MSQNPKWRFPFNGNGQTEGINDSGIETFRGNKIESLAREVIQNSLDAEQKDNSEPVVVRFKHYKLDSSKLPLGEKFEDILKACLEFWSDNPKAEEFFKEALESMREKKNSILKISDYNTKGLTGDPDDKMSNWHNLIKSVGVSNKNTGAGGSFGIGKHAPFACSNIRTVFYGTKDINGDKKFQGVSKLATHESVEDRRTTRATGYYSRTDENLPVKNFSLLNEFFDRKEEGTDIFIPGFKEDNNWREKIIKSVLDNFFVAVHRNRLIVKVGEVKITSDNLIELLDEYLKNDSDYNGDKYYRAMMSTEQYYFEEEFEEISDKKGKLKLFILPKKNYPKRVAMVRKTGMKIFDKGSFRTSLKFAGVLIAEGKELNEFLRLLEPPTHDNWQPDRHKDSKYARRIRGHLYSWINDRVNSISISEDVEELDIEGMNKYLPDVLEETRDSEDKETETKIDNDKVKKISINKVERNNKKNKFDGEKDTGGRGEKDFPEDGKKGKKKRNRNGDWPGSNMGDKSAEDRVINLVKHRVFCINKIQGKYNAVIEADKEEEVFLNFKIIGETDIDNAPIESAVNKKTSSNINIQSEGVIGPLKLEKEETINIEINLREAARYAMEVNLNEN